MGFWSSIASFISTAVKNTVEGLKWIGKTAVDGMIWIGGKLVDGLKWIQDKISSLFSWIWNAVTGFVKFIYNAICELVRLIIDSIKWMINITKKVGKFICDTVSSAISFAKYACSMAKDMMRLIIDGIKSIWENPKILKWVLAAGLAAGFALLCPDIISKILNAVTEFFTCEKTLDDLESRFSQDMSPQDVQKNL
jgi:phage-related protein